MQKVKKILFVSGSSIGYGADYSMIQIINKLKKEGNEAIVILPAKGRTCELLKENNIAYNIIPFKNWIHYDTTLIGKYVKPVLKVIINLYLTLKTYFKLKSKYNVIGVYSNSFTNFYSILVSRIFKVPHIQHIREFGVDDFGWKFDFGRERTIKFATRYSSKLICISNAVKKSYIDYSNKEKMITIYNGLPLTNNLNHDFNEKILKIIMVGRLSFEKRQLILLKACKLLIDENICDFYIDLYGDGEDLEKLKKYTKDNKLEKHVNFKGYSKKIDYSNYHIGIICSNSEGFGRVVVEYMMNSLITIGANGGAIPELIENEKSGLLFCVDDEKELKDKIKMILNNRALCERISENGRERAIKQFNEDLCLGSIYEECSKIFEF